MLRHSWPDTPAFVAGCNGIDGRMQRETVAG
jgi:hypothetical protein